MTDDDKIATEVTKPEDIQYLPWYGNYFSDKPSFDKCDAYIILPTTSREDKRRAYIAMGIYGMGIDEECTDEELDSYLKEHQSNGISE